MDPASRAEYQFGLTGLTSRTKWVMTPGPKKFVDGEDAKKFMKSIKIKE